LAIAISAAFYSTVAAAQSLPIAVPDRVGRAGEFVYNYTAFQYKHRLADRDVYWSNQQARDVLHFPDGTFSGAYVPVNRVPVHRQEYGLGTVITACGQSGGGGCDLNWFRSNHPQWIVYKSDQMTPAYMFDDKDWIPVDISNPEVQSWLITNYYAPLMKLGYQALSIDNVSPSNDFGEAGVCSIAPTTHCTADGGVWLQLYSGQKGDAAFADARILWARALTAWAHSIGKSTMANITYTRAALSKTASLVNSYDIWYDEFGITSASVPSTCEIGVWSAGPYWIEKLAFITSLNSGSGPKAYISENSVCPAFSFHQPGKNSNFEVVEYVVANYLLLKNAHTYLWMFFSTGIACGPAAYCDDQPGASWPQYWLQHGTPSGPYAVTAAIYHRTFTNALAIVNPSLTEDHVYDLGTSVYHRYDCSHWSGVITVPKKSGMVLLPGVSSGSNCVRTR
jgi:hypothetical protein